MMASKGMCEEEDEEGSEEDGEEEEPDDNDVEDNGIDILRDKDVDAVDELVSGVMVEMTVEGTFPVVETDTSTGTSRTIDANVI